MSLRRRVLLGFAIVAVALVGTNVALASLFRDDLMSQTDRDLTETASRPVLARRPDRGPVGGAGAEAEPLSDLYIAVARPDGGGLTRLGRGFDAEQSPPAPTADQLVASQGRPFTTVSADGDGSWRVVAVPSRAGGRILVVASELDPVLATLRRMGLIQVAGSAAVLAALGAVLWWVLRLGVRPLVAMASVAEDIAADGIAVGDLSRRVEHSDERTEAGRLAMALNSMLAAIEQAFRQREASEARLRQFAADASHELRTPLTSIRGYADLWRAGGLRDPDQLDQAMRRLSEEGYRMGDLVDDLLLLARLDQERPTDRRAVRLDRLAADAVADAWAVEPERPLDLDVVPVTVAGDEGQLRQVLANLLANARTHTPPTAPVRVCVSTMGPMARLEVVDRGPGIDPAALDHVFERFYRGDPSRVRETGGSGLGLSIVDAIATSHGGTATATSTAGTGSRFIVELPLLVDAGGGSEVTP
jgi:two-component system OmpR family sensor kinase